METKKKNDVNPSEGDENVGIHEDLSTDPSAAPETDHNADLSQGQVKENNSEAGSGHLQSGDEDKAPSSSGMISPEELLKLEKKISKKMVNLSLSMGLNEQLKLIAMEERLHRSYRNLWVLESNRVFCSLARQRIKIEGLRKRSQTSSQKVNKAS